MIRACLIYVPPRAGSYKPPQWWILHTPETLKPQLFSGCLMDNIPGGTMCAIG
jgi:hypothetical protein